ncbi:MAG: hypothetical protein WBG50_01810 [Desulfomonilaceae bacterium]
MVRVEFSDEEAALVREILESYVSELGAEIHKTDTFTFRSNLKHNKAIVMDLIGRMHKMAA